MQRSKAAHLYARNRSVSARSCHGAPPSCRMQKLSRTLQIVPINDKPPTQTCWSAACAYAKRREKRRYLVAGESRERPLGELRGQHQHDRSTGRQHPNELRCSAGEVGVAGRLPGKTVSPYDTSRPPGGRLRNYPNSFAKLKQQIVSAIYQLIVGNYHPEISNLWSRIEHPSKSSTPRAGLCLGVEQREVENVLGVSVPSPRGTSLG